jgi:flagellar basal body-associated protein FliL
MSEAAEAAPAKKKGKLPVIIALVVLLFGGGFFGMKMKGGDKKKEVPKIELGEGDSAVIEMEEKLYNLADKQTFLRVTLALHLKKGFDASHLTKDVSAAVDDAVLGVLSTKLPQDFFGIANQTKLKRELAWAVNAQLRHHDKELMEAEKAEKEAAEKAAKKKKKKGEEEHAEEEGHHNEAFDPAFEPEDPTWDSDEGPVLKVYFKALAIQ